MDVYGGGIGPRAARVRAEVGGLLETLGLAHREAGAESALASVWTEGRGEVTRAETDDVEVLFDGYLHHHAGTSLAAALPDLASRVISRRRVLEGRESGIFNLVVLDKRTGAIHLANDPSGLLPLFHSRTDDGFVFASHLYLTAKALQAEPDLMGVASLITLGIAVGSRTYFRDLQRLHPGEVVTYEPRSGHLEQTYSEHYFGHYAEPGPDLSDAAWEALVDATRPVVDAGRSVGVMLSEGFDSRLVAGVLRELGADLHTFTHATPGTKGTGIVGQVSAQLGSTHTFDHLEQGFPHDLPDLRRQLALADNLHVPFWAPGAAHFRAAGVDVATTGYALDATLGAHGIARSTGSTRARALRRYREIALQDLGRYTDSQLETLAEAVLVESAQIDVAWATARVRRFLTEDIAEQVVPHVEGIVDEIRAEHDRVRATTGGLASQVLQKYFLENRGRKFSFGQELTLRAQTPIVVPSYEPAFMRLMSSVPPRHRLHHRAYYRLLRDHLPDLARIQSGAHAMAPTAPRLVLETSRFAWKAHENRLTARFMASQGAHGTSGQRNVLFTEQTARQAPRFAIEELIGRESSPINQVSMQLTVEKIRRYQIRVYLPALYQGLELTQIFDEL